MMPPDGFSAPEDHFSKHGKTIDFPSASQTKTPRPSHSLRLMIADDNLAPVLDCGVVGDLFFRGGLCFISGASNAGKSAVAVTMAHAIENGQLFAGFQTEKTKVLYLAPERGERDIRNRLIGVRKAVGGAPIAFSPSPLSLWRGRNQADEVIRIAREIGAGAIFIDTQGAAMPGANRNAFEDASSFVAACARIQAELNAAVIVCTHPPKDNTSSIAGAGDFENFADCILRISGDDTGREFKVKKTKGGGQGKREAFELKIVSVGVNDRGEEVTAAFAEFTGKPVDEPKRPSGAEQRRLLNVITDLLAEDETRLSTPPELKLPASIKVVATLENARERYEGKRAGEKANTIARGFRDARDALERDGFIAIHSGYVWRLT